MSMKDAIRITNVERKIAILEAVIQDMVQELQGMREELQRRRGGRPRKERMNGQDPSSVEVGR